MLTREACYLHLTITCKIIIALLSLNHTPYELKMQNIRKVPSNHVVNMATNPPVTT